MALPGPLKPTFPRSGLPAEFDAEVFVEAADDPTEVAHGGVAAAVEHSRPWRAALNRIHIGAVPSKHFATVYFAMASSNESAGVSLAAWPGTGKFSP
jgi:hypothetical protein